MTLRTLERMAATAACAVAFAAIGCGSQAMHENTQPVRVIPTQTTTQSITRCAEDDPCWDCRHMGNRLCGPQHGTTYIHPTGITEVR